jgi:hypothetical protein
LQELVIHYNIKKQDMYNMDEKGLQLEIGQCLYVMVDQDQKTVYQVEDGSQELVTIIEAVYADGTFLPPSVIFKVKHQDLKWGRNKPRCTRHVQIV